MYCARCGDEQVEGSRFCKNCGAPLDAAAGPPPAAAAAATAGRGAVILTLGILSLVLLGLLTGIPAWIMGHRDLKRIRSGEIAAGEASFTKAGMIMGIVGTCISILTIIFVIFFALAFLRHGGWHRGYRVEATRDRMLVELRAIANDAFAYRTLRAAREGEPTYVGYAIPDRLRSTAIAEYSEGEATSVVISFSGESHDGKAAVTVAVDAEGKIVSVHFGEGADDGEASPDARDAEPRASPAPLPA